MKIQERLRQLRKQLNLSQTAFAKRIGVTYSTISLIESGKINLSESNLKLICMTFNVNMSWLRDGRDGNMFNDVDDKHELLNIAMNMKPLMLKTYIKMGRVLLDAEDVAVVEKEEGLSVSRSRSRELWLTVILFIEQKCNRGAIESASPERFGEVHDIEGLGELATLGCHDEKHNEYHFQFAFTVKPDKLTRPCSIDVKFTTCHDNEHYSETIEDDPEDIDDVIFSKVRDDIDYTGNITIDEVKFYTMEGI